jgi:hypothetical protein
MLVGLVTALWHFQASAEQFYLWICAASMSMLIHSGNGRVHAEGIEGPVCGLRGPCVAARNPGLPDARRSQGAPLLHHVPGLLMVSWFYHQLPLGHSRGNILKRMSKQYPEFRKGFYRSPRLPVAEKVFSCKA